MDCPTRWCGLCYLLQVLGWLRYIGWVVNIDDFAAICL